MIFDTGSFMLAVFADQPPAGMKPILAAEVGADAGRRSAWAAATQELRWRLQGVGEGAARRRERGAGRLLRARARRRRPPVAPAARGVRRARAHGRGGRRSGVTRGCEERLSKARVARALRAAAAAWQGSLGGRSQSGYGHGRL